MGSGTLFDKVIAIIVALILWVYVVNVVNPPSSTTVSSVPVQLLNQEVLAASNLAIAGSDKYTVDIVLEGARSDIITIDPNDVTATADVFGFSKGQNYLEVKVSVPEKITVAEVKSPRIQVYIDELVVVSKSVSLSIEDVEKDYEVGGIILHPESINVTGAKSIVDKVQVVQVKVSEAQLSTDASTVQLSAVPVNNEGEEVPGVRVSAAYVDLTATLYKTKVVPLEVPVEGAPTQDMELIGKSIPETITIKGNEQALAAIDVIVASPLSLQGVTQDITLPIVPMLPQGVEVAAASLNLTASFTLVAVTEVSFEYSSDDVWIFNIPTGYSVAVFSNEFLVTARGEKGVVEVLQPADLQPAVNVEGLVAGDYNWPISIRYEQQLVNVTISPATVRIRVTMTETPDVTVE